MRSGHLVAITGGSVVVDFEDMDLLEMRRWFRRAKGYVTASHGYGKTIRLHRVILERSLGRSLTRLETVDHINGDPSDNRRENLRVATQAENLRNRRSFANSASTFKGVFFEKDRGLWGARIQLDGKIFTIARFNDEAEAAWHYDQWAIELHGPFARLNFEYL